MAQRLALAAVGLAALAPASASAAAPNVVFTPVPVAAPDNYSTGVRAVDLNGDRRPDIATVDGRGSVRVLLARGAAKFRKPVTYRLGRALGSFEVSDLNRDKELDLIVATPDLQTAPARGGIFVLYGTGSGGFAAPRLVETGESSSAVAVGDVNNDGLVDIVTANGGPTYIPRAAGDGVTVLINRGDGQFAAQPATNLIGAYTIALGDLNGDRIPELFTGGLSVYPGTSSGGFGAPTDYPAEDGDVAAVKLLDLNKDSHPDVVVSLGSGIKTYLGLGDGRLREVQYLRRSEFADPGGQALVTGDFNRDGRVDVVTATDDHVLVMLGRGGGGFAEPVRYPSPVPHPATADAADFNGDGRPDLVVAENPGRLAVLLNARTAARARPLLPAARTPLIEGDHSVRVPVACTHGAAPCYGTLVIWRDAEKAGAATFDVSQGQRQLVRVIVPTGRAGLRLAAFATTDAGLARRTITLTRPSPADRRRACYPPGAEPILRNGTMRVFRLPGGPSAILTGCLFRFGDWISFGSVDRTRGPFATRGSLIGYLGDEDCGFDTCSPFIHVFDVAADQAVVQEPLHAPCAPASPCQVPYTVEDLVVGRGGAVAWSLCLTRTIGYGPPDPCRPHNARVRVWMLDGRGARLVDDAARIDPTSVAPARNGSGFTWRRAGRTHSATFVGAPTL